MAAYTPAVGDLVVVGPAYVGSGNYAPDGCEGTHTVVGAVGGGDYYLARGDLRHDPRKGHWTVIAHTTRVSPA